MAKKQEEKLPIISKEIDGIYARVQCTPINDLKILNFFLSNDCKFLGSHVNRLGHTVFYFERIKKKEKKVE